MTLWQRWKLYRARQALRRAVRLAGASTIAQWVLDGTLPDGEDCPFGCSTDLARLETSLDVMTRDLERTRGSEAALRAAYNSQVQLTGHVVSVLAGQQKGPDAAQGPQQSG